MFNAIYLRRSRSALVREAPRLGFRLADFWSQQNGLLGLRLTVPLGTIAVPWSPASRVAGFGLTDSIRWRRWYLPVAELLENP